MDHDLLDLINEADCHLWNIFSRQYIVDSNRLLYDTLSPTNWRTNSIYPARVSNRFSNREVLIFASYYQVHGLEGFLRDFHGEFRHRRLAHYSYHWFDPQVSALLIGNSPVQVQECDLRAMESFLRDASECFEGRRTLMDRLVLKGLAPLNKANTRLMRLMIDGELAGTAAFLSARAGVHTIVDFVLHPKFQGRRLSAPALQSLLAVCPERTYIVTDHPTLRSHTLPASGFHKVGELSVIPLNSLLR